MFAGLTPTLSFLQDGMLTRLKKGDIVRIEIATGMMGILRDGQPLTWRNNLVGSENKEHLTLNPVTVTSVWVTVGLMSASAGLAPNQIDRGSKYLAFEMAVAAVPPRDAIA